MVSHLVTQDLNPSSKLPSSIVESVVVAASDAVVVAVVESVVVAIADAVVSCGHCCCTCCALLYQKRKCI